MIRYYLLMIISFCAHSAWAQSFDNLEMARYTFHVTPKYNAPVLDLLNQLQGLQFSQTTPLYQEIYGPELTGEVYARRLRHFSGLRVGFHSDPTVMGYVRRGEPYLALTTNLFKYRGPMKWAYSMSFIIHESFHLGENGRHINGHALCPKYSLEGRELVSSFNGSSFEDESACDRKYDGSYGAQTIMLYNIGHYCTNCSNHDKQSALEAVDYFRQRIINPEAMEKIMKDMP